MRPQSLLPFLLAILLFLPLLSLGLHTRDAEVARVRAHIARAERLASQRDLASLTDAQRRARTRDLAIVEKYRRAGMFPRNHEFPSRRVPCFRDRRGTLCAMAFLIQSTGRGDLVDAVARRMNFATVTQMAADPILGPALARWLEQQGLSLAEAQAIQPSYGYEPSYEYVHVSPEYAAASAGFGTLNLLSVIANAGAFGDPSPAVSSIGVVSGFIGIGLGAGHLLEPDHSDVLGWTNMALGASSLVTSVVSLSNHDRRAPATSSAPHFSPVCGIDRHAVPYAGVSLTF